MKRKIQLLLAALALSQALAFAGEPADSAPPRHISLHEAIELALKPITTCASQPTRSRRSSTQKKLRKADIFPPYEMTVRLCN